MDIQEQLRNAHARVKVLAGKKDQVIREAGIEEQKLQQAYENLKQLGIADPENYSEEMLIELSSETQKTLETNLQNLLAALAEGEALLQEYEHAQQEQ